MLLSLVDERLLLPFFFQLGFGLLCFLLLVGRQEGHSPNPPQAPLEKFSRRSARTGTATGSGLCSSSCMPTHLFLLLQCPLALVLSLELLLNQPFPIVCPLLLVLFGGLRRCQQTTRRQTTGSIGKVCGGGREIVNACESESGTEPARIVSSANFCDEGPWRFERGRDDALALVPSFGPRPWI